jgi:hypothetical protein
MQDNIASCQAFIQQTHDIRRCFDYRGKPFRDCACVKNLTEGDFWDGAIFPVSLANQEKALHGTQLKGMMTTEINPSGIVLVSKPDQG